MITLYDLVFDKDLRPSPYCWRAKLALKHKGLAWRDEPCGFSEKQKIAFAQSQIYPVIHDGPKVVKDSWMIAQHLDAAYPDKYFLIDWARRNSLQPYFLADIFVASTEPYFDL